MKRTAAEIERDEKERPRTFDLSDPNERERLLRETVGYAKVGLKYGTDSEGAVGLCLDHHTEGHQGGWRSFEVRYGVDLSAIAARLWTESNRKPVP
jgi:hypothetical protein